MGTKHPQNSSVKMGGTHNEPEEKWDVSFAGVTGKFKPMAIGATAGALAFAIVMSGYFVSFGMMPGVPFAGFAWASTVEADKKTFAGSLSDIGTKIDNGLKGNTEAIKEVAQRINDVSEDFASKFNHMGTRIDNVARESLARTTGVSMSAMHERECEQRRAGNLEVAGALAHEVATLQAEYVGYMGSQYPLRQC